MTLISHVITGVLSCKNHVGRYVFVGSCFRKRIAKLLGDIVMEKTSLINVTLSHVSYHLHQTLNESIPNCILYHTDIRLHRWID